AGRGGVRGTRRNVNDRNGIAELIGHDEPLPVGCERYSGRIEVDRLAARRGGGQRQWGRLREPAVGHVVRSDFVVAARAGEDGTAVGADGDPGEEGLRTLVGKGLTYRSRPYVDDLKRLNSLAVVADQQALPVGGQCGRQRQVAELDLLARGGDPIPDRG